MLKFRPAEIKYFQLQSSIRGPAVLELYYYPMDQFSLGFLGFWIVTGMSLKLDMGNEMPHVLIATDFGANQYSLGPVQLFLINAVMIFSLHSLQDEALLGDLSCPHLSYLSIGSKVKRRRRKNKINHPPYHTTSEPQMQLRESIQKTKRFFHITLQNVKAFLFRGYQKLPETPPCNPFSCSSCKNQKKHQLDHLYADFSDQWESDQDRDKSRKMKGIMSSKELVKEEDNCSGNFVKLAKQSPENNKHEKGGNEEIKNMGISHQGRRVQPSSYLLPSPLYYCCSLLKCVPPYSIEVCEFVHCYLFTSSLD
ncbi:hypothetical protein AAG906_023813 [Vitis piasezkii]